ncbi:MAG: DUF885 domain-containing protein [Pseudomonadota bacterium]
MITRSFFVFLSAAMTLTGAARVVAQDESAAGDTLQTIIDDHWDWRLKEQPVFATTLGVRDYDDRLGSVSLESYDAATEKARAFMGRLEALSVDSLSPEEKINFQLLSLNLKNRIDGAAYGGKYLLLTNRYGPHTTLTRLPTRLPFFTKADFDSYVTRLADAPRYLAEATDVLKAGVEAGWTQSCAPMARVEQAIRFHLVDDVADSVFMKPFEARPNTVSPRDWRRLKANAEKTIKKAVLPAFGAYADFYADSYAPACRETVGALNFPGGDAYYAHRAGVFTTTGMSPDDIHALGLSEVARIRAEMDTIIRKVDFDGDFKAFQTYLRTNPEFYAKTEEELISFTSRIAKIADGELPKLFTRMPRMPYTVKPVPADIAKGATTAFYERPAGDGTRAGVYRINTSLLDQRPLFELEALTLHEAVPGHHFQIALAQELTLPSFRRYGGFTAFTEGWGLYAESLGLDIGFYTDPYQNFGRLSYEMWRACRLVVDTGMHAKGWSRQEAIDFMLENTALSAHNVEAEVDRYITWPGQALAYKIGQLKIKALRAKSEKALGADFDLRRFHDAVLENGAVPLSVLEQHINAWIADEKKRR